MFTWKRLRLVRGIVGSASAGLAWWLFYLLDVWSGASRSPTAFVCFFFCILGVDRALSASIDLIAIPRRRA
jgi:hypothetical protein